ncbi:tripartite tricarboxylate transporter substrate binding protein [Nitrogeniibacter aestuarii]|uniref:tripartite tricarboxylate transporter substrate binding protein n=1 Tax=Nitrogeniibacter aestuarii TaxID=2815343 RepID=UPI001E5A8094|nr:tripartite tricarboxylate transporter substrate binding protein [Nitrogeniibacter aestuarii]
MSRYSGRRFARALTFTFFAALGAISLPSAQADTFPEKPIRFVVPFSPGGGTDLVARTLGAEISKDLGQPVVIENKPGASTIIGTDTVAKADPDGYTVVISTAAHAVNPSLMAKLPYDTDKDFAPVILIARSPNILVVRPDSPYKSVKDILAAAAAKPGELTFASQGSGTSAHLAGELFKHLGKVDLIHVPYKGAGPALTDLLGGQVDMMFATAAAVGGFLESGKLRALAVTTAERSPAHPELPTVAEAGLSGFVADSWYGMYAPAGTPPEVIAKLNAAANKAAQSEAFRSRVQPEGLMISVGTPEAYDQYVRGEIDRWAKVIKAAHITTN